MSDSYKGRYYRSFLFWPVLIVYFAILCEYASVAAVAAGFRRNIDYLTCDTSAAAVTVDSACERILRGDFTSAKEIVHKLSTGQSIEGRQLGTIIDEYMLMQTRRQVSKNAAYHEQKIELENLRNKGVLNDINDVSKVLTVVIKALEYSDEMQKNVLLGDPFIQRTIRRAENIAVELESAGKWLEAYQKSYSKLAQIYKLDNTYTEYAEQLLEKADIAAFLQDSPCQACQEHYDGINKDMFIKAVDFLDSSYVNIIDYRNMAIQGINRCKLLVELMGHPSLGINKKMRDMQCDASMAALTAMLNELEQSPSPVSRDELIDSFECVLAMNESRIDEMGLPPASLIVQFSKGALSSLDPYTVIYWPSQTKTFEKELTNQFTGIGIRFSKEKESPKVISVMPDTPAYHSGIEAGDVIEAVDGVGMSRMPALCVAQSIAGPEGTKVTLTIRHEGEHESRNIILQRTKIVVPSVRGWQRDETGKWRYMIDDYNKISYIRINCFDSRTVDDFESILSDLEKQGLQGLILDLRSNPGGLLSGAIEIADKFIDEGLIARIQPRCGMPTYISADRGKTHSDCPLVVLIDRFTASSAEILTGVLQEPKYNRATIVGERSYGKSSVQSIVSHLGGGAKLKYTTAYYYLPSGHKIKNRNTHESMNYGDWGVLPDVIVELRSDELRKMTKVQRANESASKDHYSDASDVRSFSVRETIDADPQLATGILVLKSKMINSGRRLVLN